MNEDVILYPEIDEISDEEIEQMALIFDVPYDLYFDENDCNS